MRRASIALPSGHGPKPASTLIWPQAPISISELPQALARTDVRSAEANGSLLLPTMTDGNGRRTNGNGAKSLIAAHSGTARSTSAGATRKAAAIGAFGHSAIRCARRMQPRLCATITAPGVRSISRLRTLSQSARSGLCQSDCSTRRAPGKSACQSVCQWPGPELPRPGMMRTSVIFRMLPPHRARCRPTNRQAGSR
jgi:hypothetical protein